MLASFNPTICAIFGISAIRIAISGSAFVVAFLYQIYFFGIVNDAALRSLESGQTSRTSTILRSSLAFSTGSMCATATLLIVLETATIIFTRLRSYYMVALSQLFINALSFLLLLVCVFNVTLGMNASEISSAVIGDIVTRIHSEKQLAMAAVDQIQNALHCCGFHTGAADWLGDTTAQFYDVIERKSVVIMNNETDRIWFALCSERDVCIAPRSCCKTQTENCNKAKLLTSVSGVYNHTGNYAQRENQSPTIYDEGCFSVFADAVRSFSYFTAMIVLLHIMTAVIMQAIITIVISRLNGMGRIDLFTGEV
ncbi:hypothetical protein Tcan_13707 [Toxocara canis]|uniref:Tetraspanin n=1 Tax=Toxocara canis TaxID=6265 RepID=A0A0B2V4D6_TOXCA|nr:hypothetical protein Tcan_13707 [Toxocara canis]